MSLENTPNDRSDRYSDEIDLIDILRFIFQEKKKLIAFGAVGAMLGFVLMTILPGKSQIVSSVKVDVEKSLNQVPFESLKTALDNAATDPSVVEAGIQNALNNNSEFKKTFSEKGISAQDLVVQVSGEKAGNRIIEIENGNNLSTFLLKVNLPRELSYVEPDKVAILILNGIVQAYNLESRRQQSAQDSLRSTMAPTAYTLALDNFTTISGKLADLETTLMDLVPESTVRHVQSSGFAPGASVLEAQFARVRFLMGVAESKGRLRIEQRKKLQATFLELQDSLGAAQLELDVAAEAKKELLKKNLPLIQKDPLPFFKPTLSSGRSLIKLKQSYKKQFIAAFAGSLVGIFVCFFVIILSRFFKENWMKITGS